ncbi:hypothetical protein WICPIJ_005017 [Wickerhamomyces pijperi]|uniref:Uncharacterized protein n=1 Tax=Wickerhamomyces pijperi TaxID=599730 RepID=A0A9P8Q6W7_WICPI|nr:hypothetical protein WICPIJ_005017 [Wickerhamomyces pijperi]
MFFLDSARKSYLNSLLTEAFKTTLFEPSALTKTLDLPVELFLRTFNSPSPLESYGFSLLDGWNNINSASPVTVSVEAVVGSEGLEAPNEKLNVEDGVEEEKEEAPPKLKDGFVAELEPKSRDGLEASVLVFVVVEEPKPPKAVAVVEVLPPKLKVVVGLSLEANVEVEELPKLKAGLSPDVAELKVLEPKLKAGLSEAEVVLEVEAPKVDAGLSFFSSVDWAPKANDGSVGAVALAVVVVLDGKPLNEKAGFGVSVAVVALVEAPNEKAGFEAASARSFFGSGTTGAWTGAGAGVGAGEGFNLNILSDFLPVAVKVKEGPVPKEFVVLLSLESLKTESVVVGGLAREKVGPSTLMSSSESLSISIGAVFVAGTGAGVGTGFVKETIGSAGLD